VRRHRLVWVRARACDRARAENDADDDFACGDMGSREYDTQNDAAPACHVVNSCAHDALDDADGDLVCGLAP
jgi:hypothetical protein